jgi:hypothetical protein
VDYEYVPESLKTKAKLTEPSFVA